MELENVTFKELSPSEVKDAVVERLDDEMNTHLEREGNATLLDSLISDAFANKLYLKVEATTIIDSIVQKFGKQALTGEIRRLVYVGGNDHFERDQPHDRYQDALFLPYEDGEITGELESHRVWGRFPGFNEGDPFTPGEVYDIETKTVSREYDGETREFTNLTGYTHVESARGALQDYILDSESFNNELDEALNGAYFSESRVVLLQDKIQWQNTIVDFFVKGVRAQSLTHRVKDKDGQYQLEWDDSEKYNVNHVSDTGQQSLVLSLTGVAEIESGELVFYVNFYPQRMGSHFVVSENLMQMIESEDFLQSTPEQQVDFLDMMLKDTQFRAVGQIRKLNGADDGAKLITSLTGVSLVEVVD